MKTYIVQLEDHDDVISARDKISWSKARRVLLVWPRKGRLLERRVDLLLLLRHSQQLGSQLALVTRSSAVRAQARELGIPVFSDALDAQEVKWRRVRNQRKVALRNAQLKKRKLADPQSLREQRLAELRRQKEAFLARLVEIRWLRLGMFALGVLAFLLLVLAFVPGAEVVVKPVQTPQTLNIAVWAGPDILTPSASGGLPVQAIMVVVEGRDQVDSSGQVKIPERYAAGQVTLTNVTDQVVDMPQGSVLLTTTSPVVRFVTTQAVQVPAGPEKSAVAMVRAELAGSAGNVPAGKVQAIEGPVGLRLRVNNNTAIGGGADRSGRSPTAEDYRALREKMLANLKANALQEARALVRPGQRLLDGMLVLRKVVEENREPPDGQPADRLQLALRVEFEAWTVRDADLQAVALAALDANLDNLFQSVPGSLEVTFSSDPTLDPAEPAELDAIPSGAVPGPLTARWNMQVKRSLEKTWTKDAAVRSIQGRGLAEAQQILATGMSLNETPQIHIYPGWWGRLPFLPARIQLVRQ